MKRLLSFVIALSLAAGSVSMVSSSEISSASSGSAVSGDAAALVEDNAAPEDKASEETSKAVEDRQESVKTVSLGNITEEDLNKYYEMAKEINVREILENAEVILQVSQSEEFNRLMQYPEMQAFVEEALKKMENLLFEDPDLTEKILLTFGVDEKLVKIVMDVVRTASSDLVGQ